MATTFDVVADFNDTGVQPAAGNPFTYGTAALNIGFTPFSNFGNTNTSGATGETTNGGTMDNWYLRYQLAGPCVGVVATRDTLTFLPNAIPFVIPNDVLMMMPGDFFWHANLTITRFTAPSAGLFDLAGSFSDLEMSSVKLTIIVDGVTVFENSSFRGNSPYQPPISFSINDISLAQGGTTLEQARRKARSVLTQAIIGTEPQEQRTELRAVPTLAEFARERYLPHVQGYKRSWQYDEIMCSHCSSAWPEGAR